MKNTGYGLACAISCAILFAIFMPASMARGQAEQFAGRTVTGTVYFMSGRRPGATAQFRLVINRLSTPNEVQDLTNALQSGQDNMLNALRKMKAGRIQIGTGVGVDANAIIATPGDGNTKLTVLYERYLRFGELRYGTRSEDYKFGYAELFLGSKSGEGMLIPAAMVHLKGGNNWEVEDFGTFPAKLMGLVVRGHGNIEAR